MSPRAPKIVLTLDGGLIQDIQSDVPVEVLQLNVDIEGADECDIVRFKDASKKPSEATAWIARTGKNEMGSLNPKWVNKVFDEVDPQIKRIQNISLPSRD